LAHILTWQDPRKLSANLTLEFKHVLYQVQTKHPTYALRHAPVLVRVDDVRNVSILYKGKPLEFTIFHEQSKQAQVVQAKHIDLALQNQSKVHKLASDHPWRKGFATPLSKRNTPLGDIST